MKKKILFLQIILLLVCIGLAGAQDKLPREYVPPEELISLKSDLDFSIALDLLSEFAIKFSGKPIHDPDKRTGSIGIDIQSMPWQKALELILSRRGLWYVEKDHFFEIIKPEQSGSSANGENLTKFSDGTELDPKSKEVKIEAIFFEGDRKTLKEIGIDWSTFYQGEVELTANQVGALSLSEDIVNLTVKIPNKLYGVDVQALLRILDSENIGQVLAQPHIIAVEGKEGSIQVGQDFSIKQRDFAGNVTDRIMRVTPYIFEDAQKGKIIFLKIHVERSQAYPDVVSTIIKKSEANTFVQLYDGEETLIGGLYSTEKTVLRKGIPLLKDLPWWFFGLRYLFGYNRNEEAQKELIIIIKASLLPDVFSRARQSKHRSSGGEFYENPEMKIRQLKGSAYSIDRNKYKNGYREYERLRKRETQQVMAMNEQSQMYAPIPETSNYDNSGYSIIEHGPRESSDFAIPAPSEQNQYVTPHTNAKQSVAPGTTSSGYSSVQKSESPIIHKKETRTERVYYRGQIVKLQNNLALIQWQQSLNPDEMNGTEVTVLRRDANTKKFVPIGKVRIVKAVKKLAVAQRITSGAFACPELQIGDRVIAFF